MLKYIYDVEQLVFLEYKMDPFQLMSRMSVIDLQVFIQGLEEKEKERQKKNDSNKLLKSLSAIRNVLNTMNLPEI